MANWLTLGYNKNLEDVGNKMAWHIAFAIRVPRIELETFSVLG